jgi:hypothetical protein
MPNTKKTWQKSKLIILARGRPEEMVLAGCKIKSIPTTPQNRNAGCMQQSVCQLCNNPGTS